MKTHQLGFLPAALLNPHDKNLFQKNILSVKLDMGKPRSVAKEWNLQGNFEDGCAEDTVKE